VDAASAPDLPPPSGDPAPAPVDGSERAEGGLVARWKGRYEATQKELTQRLDAAREESKLVDATAAVVMRPRYASDALVAGYLAMRMFVLLFPLAYIGVAALGLIANNTSESSGETVAHTGLAGAVADSVAQAANGSQRNQVLALVIGLMAAAWAGRGALHAARYAHTIPWRLPDPKTSVATAGGLVAGVVMVFFAWFGNLTSRMRDNGWSVILVAVFTVATITAVWWLVSTRLPHRGGRLGLLPGALLVGVGSAGLHIAVTVYFAPKLSRSSQTYGALGAGVVILAYLVVVAWMIVLAAELNAGIYAVRHPDDRDEAPHPFS
jgi:uncharacterized BrkB/YihY/UPF0761 family membrane protein